MAVISCVVGHTTLTTSRILAVFSESRDRTARLAYQIDGRAPVVMNATVVPAAPYGLATFSLQGLAGESVRYGVLDYNVNEPTPDEQTVLKNAGGTFRLPSDKPQRIALVSCNDIDSHQFPKEQRGAMWKRLKALVDRGEVDLIIHAGDQIYGDGDPLGWSEAEGRTAAYRRHYVRTWAHPDVASVLSSCPNLMMWDDHEIYDGYGSNDGDRSAKAKERYLAAEQAFREFQVPLNPEQPLSSAGFGFVAQQGDVAIVAVDGRSQRNWAKGSILGKTQLDSLEVKLNELAQLKPRHVFVVVGTPVVYIPLVAAQSAATALHLEALDDIRDGWTASNNRTECRRFLMTLLNFAASSPETMVTIVAGDVHVGSLATIDTRIPFGKEQRRPRLYQVTSSGIGRAAPTGAAAFMLSFIANGGKQQLFNEDIQGALTRVNGAGHDFCISKRNFAVLDPSNGRGEWDRFGNLRVKFHVEDQADSFEHLLPKI